MAEQIPEQEPSMEEILASIRRIISDDGEKRVQDQTVPAKAATAKPVLEPDSEPEPEFEGQPHQEEDVLELTDEVQSDGTVVNLKTGDVVDAQEDEGVEIGIGEGIEDEVYGEVEPETVGVEKIVGEIAPVVENAIDADRLISESPIAASVSSLAELASAVDTHRRASDVSIGPKTIEDLVKEVMRPMIREWLDEHLPSLVERLVGREIERLTREAEETTQR